MFRDHVKLEIAAHIFLSKIFLCGVYSWENGKAGDFPLGIVTPSRQRRWAVYLLLGVSVAYCGVVLAQSVLVQTQGNLSTAQKWFSYGFPIFLLAGTTYRVNFLFYEREAIHLLNLLLRFETTYPFDWRWSKYSILLTRVVLAQGLGTCTFLPLLVLIMIYKKSCTAPFLGSLLFRDALTGACLVPSWEARISVALWDFGIWLHLATAAGFFVYIIFFLGLKCLGQYLNDMKRLWTGVDPALSFFTGYKVFRSLQVIGNRFNECFAPVFLPLLNLTAALVLVICLYVSVKLSDEIEMPGFAFFPLAGADVLVIAVAMNRVASLVYIHSKQIAFLGKLRTLPSSGYGKGTFLCALKRRLVRSLTPIKARMGHANFVDRMTPIIIVNFCLSQTVSLCLLK